MTGVVEEIRLDDQNRSDSGASRAERLERISLLNPDGSVRNWTRPRGARGMGYEQEPSASARESYEKPEVRRINLAPEEMAATGCKTATGPGRSIRCQFGAARCRSLGS